MIVTSGEHQDNLVGDWPPGRPHAVTCSDLEPPWPLGRLGETELGHTVLDNDAYTKTLLSKADLKLMGGTGGWMYL